MCEALSERNNMAITDYIIEQRFKEIKESFENSAFFEESVSTELKGD